MFKVIQQSDPDDPHRSESVDKSKDALLERAKPRHRRLEGGGEENSSSSSASSNAGNSMVGKAIESSNCWEASAKELISKLSNEPTNDRDRFKFFVQIMGVSLLITGVSRILSAFSRASVAGEKELEVVMQLILYFIFQEGLFRSRKFMADREQRSVNTQPGEEQGILQCATGFGINVG